MNIGIGKNELKIFVICLLLIIGASMFFIPPSQYNAFLWNYLHETAPIYWIGQSFWLFLGAFVLALFYIIARRLL